MRKNKLTTIILIALIAIVVLIVGIFLSKYSGNTTKEITEIVLNKNSISLFVGEIERLEINILPNDATDKTVVWESDNSEIVSVNSGIIEAKKAGNAIIKVQTIDGKVKNECIVEVKSKEVEKIELDKNDIEMKVGEHIILKVTITPSELQENKITWESDNTSVATVNEDGTITAINNGVANIKAIIGNLEAICKVNISTPVDSIELNKTKTTLLEGSSETLLFKITPTSASNNDVIWSSSNSNIVSVDNGKVIAKSSGTAEITVATKDGNKKATCIVTVIKVKTFNQQNDAVTEYMKSPSASKAQSTYTKFKCNKSGGISCHRSKKYSSSISGTVNIYKYDKNTNEKTLIVTTDSKKVNYYLTPNSTYYIESTINKDKVEAVTITGNVRMMNISNISNMRDLGGWKADGGTVKYGKIYRSANTNSLTSKSALDILGIKKVVDLRADNEINHSSAVESIRQRIAVKQYLINSNSNVREAVTAIMKAVVEQNKNVLFNCNFGRDRTGTVAYVIEGLLGVSANDRKTDYELTYFCYANNTRDFGSFKSLVSSLNSYNQNKYEQEKFINWYLNSSSNKSKDLKLVNDFRKKMIDGNPHTYKLSNGSLTISLQ